MRKKYTAANTAKRNSTDVLYYKQEEEKILPALLYYRQGTFFFPTYFSVIAAVAAAPLPFPQTTDKASVINPLPILHYKAASSKKLPDFPFLPQLNVTGTAPL